MYEEFANRLSQTNTEPTFNPVMAHFFLFSFDSSGNKSLCSNVLPVQAVLVIRGLGSRGIEDRGKHSFSLIYA